jgi:hypothetical protein
MAVRAAYDARAATYATTIAASSGTAFPNTTNEPFSFGPSQMALLSYSPVDAMWGSGGEGNQTCTWWMQTSL